MQSENSNVQPQVIETPPIAELIADPLVCEMFASFSGFFTHEECYIAIQSCNGDIAEAAAWLVDEGEKERGKKALVKRRTALLAESEIIPKPIAELQPIQSDGSMPPGGMPPPGGKRPQDYDVGVKEGSVLVPSNIASGKWTISAPDTSTSPPTQYVTYHNLTLDNGYAKVFSCRPEDVRVINDTKKDGRHDDESDEAPTPSSSEEVQSASLSVDGSAQAPKDESDKKAAEGSEAVNGTVDISGMKEEDLYEGLKLYGTFLKKVKLPRTNSLADLTNHNTYVIYDHCHRKYYIMMLASTYRYIAVAEDLTEMFSLLKEHSSKSTSAQDDDDLKTLSDFALRTLETLDDIGKARFNMPWRWNPWSNNYQQALQQFGNESLDIVESSAELGRTQSSILEQTRILAEQRKKQMNKLTTRLEKVTAAEKAIERAT